MVRLAVYGTLREGGRLHYYLGGAQLMGAQYIDGYAMYSLGSFPYIIKGAGRILVEVYEVEDNEAAHAEDMERGAGYEMDVVRTSWGDAHVFYMTEAAHRREIGWHGMEPPKIHNGDWLSYAADSREGIYQ